MANNADRGKDNKKDDSKEKNARTAGGTKPDVSTQAGSGGRGGHRKRKGGSPQG